MKSQTSALKQNVSQKWAITLCYEEQEKLEPRVAQIIEYLAQNCDLPNQWIIADIDATGRCGDQLTKKGNNEEVLRLSSADLLSVLKEEGQVIELDARLVQNGHEVFKILIRDGVSVDVLGSGDVMPLTVLGKYVTVDKSFFLWC
ncbi:MAG: hypothetical protein QQW96_10240 [Tychonema bourrellyi B0820]|uniref:Uncharacterized protein n=1 Tax=Tychonema bourrellyi FEM_GT703 TaxID=2040638 RepID=A0A2G4F3X7_9CYAN|nr:hypothetical protein [Tychonema bourrellyi]MDQ2098013.1 hypothetical protein [Tychonema bourrellyi B0820]PHX56449.1 hypothetical protein CP500_005455 [Tychonema bourrellyi FEM_GT703]